MAVTANAQSGKNLTFCLGGELGAATKNLNTLYSLATIVIA
ncbi:MAG: hypothetical protein ACKVOM_05910 [Ferruginibacter sp.]